MNKNMYYFILFVLVFCSINASPQSKDDELILSIENSTDVKNEFPHEYESQNQTKFNVTETSENHVLEILNMTEIENKGFDNSSEFLNGSLDQNLNENVTTLHQNNELSNSTDDENENDDDGFANKSMDTSYGVLSRLWDFFDTLFGNKLPKLFSSDRKVKTVIDTSNKELAEISEILLERDVNNAKSYVSLRAQMKIVNFTKEDLSPEPLFIVNDNVWKISTISAMKELYDNYEQDVNINEIVTNQEKLEEDKFLDTILATPVMQRLTEFLIEKDVFTSDKNQQKEVFATAWFGLYPRMRGKITSSGFEHIFLSEIKKKKISGLHNWLYFHTEESAQRANYLGHMRIIDLGTKGYILKFAFSLNGIYKPVDSMFIGTSPELEMALYSLCFFTRADRKCPIFLNGHKVNMRTHSYRWQGNKFIGSGFPEI